jgi:hypothetical protein
LMRVFLQLVERVEHAHQADSVSPSMVPVVARTARAAPSLTAAQGGPQLDDPEQERHLDHHDPDRDCELRDEIAIDPQVKIPLALEDHALLHQLLGGVVTA